MASKQAIADALAFIDEHPDLISRAKQYIEEGCTLRGAQLRLEADGAPEQVAIQACKVARQQFVMEFNEELPHVLETTVARMRGHVAAARAVGAWGAVASLEGKLIEVLGLKAPERVDIRAQVAAIQYDYGKLSMDELRQLQTTLTKAVIGGSLASAGDSEDDSAGESDEGGSPEGGPLAIDDPTGSGTGTDEGTGDPT